MRDKNKKRPANRTTYPKMPWKDKTSSRSRDANARDNCDP